jgi:isopentenyl-diphosphate delta-isomerase
VSQLPGRKRSHLELCVRGDVEQRGGSLLDQVHLLHEALPEVSWADVDLSVELFGRRLLAPLVISGMSGGTAEAGELNRALATAAQKLGLGLGVGSQRIMLQHPETTDTFQVRDVAPDILLLANLGAVQARDAGVEGAARLVEAIGADALCIHLNPAQELVQDEGDRDFRGCLGAIRAIAAELPVPVIAKETGCGLGPAALERLRAAGIDWVDVAGAGGTTWPGVEGLRGSERQRALGAELRAWGIPTAAAVVYARRAGLRTIASGGIRSGLDAARALALGADATGVALPFLRAFASGGLPGVLRTAEALVEALRAVTLLTGAYNVGSLRAAPTVIGHELRSWLD